MTRFKVLLLAALLLASTSAKALLPIALAPGLWITFQNGAMALSYAGAVALLGTFVAFMEVPRSDDPTKAGLRVHLNEAQAPPTPEGWTAGVAGADPVPPDSRAATQTGGAPYPSTTLAQRCFAYDPQAGFFLDPSCGTSEQVSLCRAWAPTQSGQAFCRVTHNGQCYADSWNGAGTLPAGCTGTSAPTFTCPSGYVVSGSTCVRNVAPELVPYPEDGICIVTLRGGLYDEQARDPDCANVDRAFGTADPTAAYQWQERNGETTKLTRDPDGTQHIEIIQGNGDGTSTVTELLVGPAGRLSGANQRQIQGEGVLRDPNNAAPQMGNCGGPGQRPCSVLVDDSGFSGQSGFVGEKGSLINQAFLDRQAQVEGLSSQGTAGIGAGWLPSVLPGAAPGCQPLPINLSWGSGTMAGLSASESIDICDKVDIGRQIVGFLFGLWAVWSVSMTFFNANGGRG